VRSPLTPKALTGAPFMLSSPFPEFGQCAARYYGCYSSPFPDPGHGVARTVTLSQSLTRHHFLAMAFSSSFTIHSTVGQKLSKEMRLSY
jgi:hypothetical protein